MTVLPGHPGRRASRRAPAGRSGSAPGPRLQQRDRGVHRSPPELCAVSDTLPDADRDAGDLQGLGGAMMVPVGRLAVLARPPTPAGPGQGDRLPDLAGTGRPGARARGGRAVRRRTPPGGGSSCATCRSAWSPGCWRWRMVPYLTGSANGPPWTGAGFLLTGGSLAGAVVGMERIGDPRSTGPPCWWRWRIGLVGGLLAVRRLRTARSADGPATRCG